MEKKTETYPIVPLRGIVLFPYMQLNFDVARPDSIQAVNEAIKNNSEILLVSQHDMIMENPKKEDLYEVGTVARIKQVMHMPGKVIRLLVAGQRRGIIREYSQTVPFFKGVVEEIDETYCGTSTTVEAYCRLLIDKAADYFVADLKSTPERLAMITNVRHLGKLCDLIAAMTDIDMDVKQDLLNETDFDIRADKLLDALTDRIRIFEVENDISKKAKIRMNGQQREFYLREQMQVIREELGETDDADEEVAEFTKKLADMQLEDTYKEKLQRDIGRFAKLPQNSPESGLMRMYLETVFDLPWNEKTKDNNDINHAEAILNEDHYGLEKVKERIVEFLAVRVMTKSKNTTVLCLEGPPGVGKTSVAKSIARALNRKFVRISLGGVHDESDIRGHRKTYVGAMEGRIIAAVREAKVNNPLILLDEVDKVGTDYRGDPSAALLEVLDNEQNKEFRDHYIEIPFDLSDVLFITTANTVENISQPLLDRMEIIRLTGYTDAEKFQIAKRYLYKKALAKTGMTKRQFRITDGALTKIIENYTREAGVRKLEQTLESLCRKAAKQILETECESVTVNKKNLSEHLGREKFRFDMMNEKDEVGVARGLAWTSVGGETLSVEANVMSGTGKIELTGKLGDVMQESAKAAISYIRASADKLDIDGSFYKDKDIHIHVPEGAVPKDGPSAGITMATAVISSLTNRPVRRDIAMTGEITLRGKVLPIGGLKEKSMAAYRAGIRTVIIPEENRPDIDDVPKEIRDSLHFIPVSDMDSVIAQALV